MKMRISAVILLLSICKAGAQEGGTSVEFQMSDICGYAANPDTESDPLFHRREKEGLKGHYHSRYVGRKNRIEAKKQETRYEDIQYEGMQYDMPIDTAPDRIGQTNPKPKLAAVAQFSARAVKGTVPRVTSEQSYGSNTQLPQLSSSSSTSTLGLGLVSPGN